MFRVKARYPPRFIRTPFAYKLGVRITLLGIYFGFPVCRAVCARGVWLVLRESFFELAFENAHVEVLVVEIHRTRARRSAYGFRRGLRESLRRGLRGCGFRGRFRLLHQLVFELSDFAHLTCARRELRDTLG